jgi:hypothetical protein
MCNKLRKSLKTKITINREMEGATSMVFKLFKKVWTIERHKNSEPSFPNRER